MTTTIRPIQSIKATARDFEPGSTGWTANDLEDPQIAAKWFDGHYEIIDGVLAQMPPAYLYSNRSLRSLTKIVEAHLLASGSDDEFIHEIDLVIDEARVVKPDEMLVTADFLESQVQVAQASGHADVNKTRIFVPPKLVIESVSTGHERHDHVLKKRWYAEFGVPNYWLIDAFARTLACYTLNRTAYELDCQGSDLDELSPKVFAPLRIHLKDVWRPLVKKQLPES